MDKQVVRIGLISIVVLIVFFASVLYPPGKTLKPGLDLAGGTSLIYEIDTIGLQPSEVDGLAQRMVPILMRRIDPGNIQNIVMRPQGDTRVEIQVPLATEDARQKRRIYDAALEEIEKDNINPAVIRRVLKSEPAQRDETFKKLAGDNKQRAAILDELTKAYDELSKARTKSDELQKDIDSIKILLQKENLDANSIANMLPSWAGLDANGLTDAIGRYLGATDANSIAAVSVEKKNAVDLLRRYIEIYKQWSVIADRIADPKEGLSVKYHNAQGRLRDINLNVDTIVQLLELGKKSAQRKQGIDELKKQFPERAAKIDALAKAFEQYRPLRGRVDGPEDVKRMVRGAGVLEFRIMPTLGDGSLTQDEAASMLEQLKSRGHKHASTGEYVWVQVEDTESFRSDGIIGEFAEKRYVLLSNKKDQTMLKSYGSKQWKLTNARPDIDQTGRRAIAFSLNETGSGLFYNLTRNNMGKPLCILLDNQAISAPTIQAAIRGNGIITGDFTQTTQQDMVNKLNAGSLPARLIDPPLSEKTIGASIGEDNRDRGIMAGYISLAVVSLFMLIYYMTGGLIANIALVLNILFVLGIMALINATFTLPGIAGVILTIGMSVDANVLIFERVREEQQRGSHLRTAIANGYQKAFMTIFDSNLTTILTALILYMVASEEIKGFALTLILGIASSMFTALFVTRLIFQILLNRGILKEKLNMLKLIGVPNINWMGLRGIFITFSVIITIAGMAIFFTRDEQTNSKYDIEFTGGTSVTINLNQPLNRDQVEDMIRRKGRQLNNPGIASARVYSVGQQESRTQYEITTTETNKTTAVVKTDAQKTPQDIKNKILEVQKKYPGRLGNLFVNADSAAAGQFIITTSQVNISLVSEILTDAFGENCVIAEPSVDEIVNRAIHEAFEGKLLIKENINPSIVSISKIDEAMVDAYPELADYLGGLKILCRFDRPVTVDELHHRLNDLRFKSDMAGIAWYPFDVYPPQFGQADPNQTFSELVYVSIDPEAGFRELSTDEQQAYEQNEQNKILAAGRLATALPRMTQIAPSVGSQAKTQALIAIVLSLIAIVVYIWFRFGTFGFGIASIISLVHDTCITLGAIAACTYIAGTSIGKMLLISDFKIDLTMIAAILTLIGYSLNDTIVVFDRIRENRGRLTTLNADMISRSINQTLSRTLLTGATTLISVLVMYIWGGPGLRNFTFVMLFGIIIGTYSSIAIAAPILLIGKTNKTKVKTA